ncbi:MAG: ABC transporter ATP-binding protein [Alphaproteobacteria bacterium]|nr:ABC transporter ATP-binding protein [Alphaproteobacteria bacterium]
MSNEKNVLELRNIIKNYRQGKQNLEVLSGVNLEIAPRDVIALVGQSGSGKSTLLQIAGLLDKQTAGKVIINGENVGKVSDDVRTSLRRDYIGFVYQYHNLLGDFSALENVMLPMLIAKKDKKEAYDRAIMLLEKMHLSHRINHRPAEMSGGEQQRVAIARALANSPKLLLADEPTGNLDPNTAEEVFSSLLDIIKETGLAALIATHNMDLASRMNKQYKLKDGVLININEPILSKITKNFY